MSARGTLADINWIWRKDCFSKPRQPMQGQTSQAGQNNTTAEQCHLLKLMQECSPF